MHCLHRLYLRQQLRQLNLPRVQDHLFLTTDKYRVKPFFSRLLK